ncbi:hypothetical protein Tco_0622489 [Tanacetum coccineum]
MDLFEFYKELEAEFFGAGAKLMGLQLLQLDLRLEKNPSRSFRPINQSPLCDCVVNPLVDFLVLVMSHETKHRSTDVMVEPQ